MTGEELQARRRALGLTQEQLARALGLSINTLQNWEINRYAPPASTAALLERALQQLEQERQS